MSKNKPSKFILITILCLSLMTLIGCRDKDNGYGEIEGFDRGFDHVISQGTFTAKVDEPATDDEEDFVESPLNDFLPQNTATVVLDHDEATINHEIADTNIYMDEGNLIVDSTKKMTLIVSGVLDGSIVINKPDGKFQLILDGVTITANTGPAINFQTEKRVFLVINDGTVNHVTDSSIHPLMDSGSKTKAAIFSEEQLIISGHGELNVSGMYKHGIASDDYLKIRSGHIKIHTALSDGLRANDYVAIDGGEIEINADGDGIEVEKGFVGINGGRLTIHSNNDGIKASNQEDDPTITPYVMINHGVMMINSAKKGIVSDGNLAMHGGVVSVHSTGDGLFAKGRIALMGGYLYAHSAEKQSLDGDQGIELSGGIAILQSDGTEPALKSDDDQIIIKGGTIVIAGAVDLMIQSEGQGYLKCGTVSENEIIDIRGQNSLLSTGFIRAYHHVVISTPEIRQGTSYDLYTGGSFSGDHVYGLLINGTYQGGSLRQTIVAR